MGLLYSSSLSIIDEVVKHLNTPFIYTPISGFRLSWAIFNLDIEKTLVVLIICKSVAHAVEMSQAIISFLCKNDLGYDFLSPNSGEYLMGWCSNLFC